MRPRTLDEYAGQQHILGLGKPLRVMIERDTVSSMILWGPPGTGKTSLAKLIARLTRCEFIAFSAVLGGTKEVKAVMADAERVRRAGIRTILFVDEIHRFNRAQQDAFLPYVERGDITLIGATTENPSFEVNAALLSRCRVYRLEGLTTDQVVAMLQGALQDPERGLGRTGLDQPPWQVQEGVLERVATLTGGDARAAYGVLESLAAASTDGALTVSLVESVLQAKTTLYDKSGEEHFNLISALHKSVRSSDVDGALYWLARMLEGGEDRMYLARRLVRMAVEDIGLADPRAVEQAVACQQAVHFLGIPEGDQALAQITIYLAVAPKSDASYRGLNSARQVARTQPPYPVPMNLRNAPTQAMKTWGYGQGYQHAHDHPDGVNGMACLPEELRGTEFYHPAGRGVEERIAARLEQLRAIRKGPKGD